MDDHERLHFPPGKVAHPELVNKKELLKLTKKDMKRSKIYKATIMAHYRYEQHKDIPRLMYDVKEIADRPIRSHTSESCFDQAINAIRWLKATRTWHILRKELDKEFVTREI
jgi:hypothetical protein